MNMPEFPRLAQWGTSPEPVFWPSASLLCQLVTGGDAQGATEALEPLMSIDEVAQVLRISERGVYRLIGRGELVPLKVGGRTLVEPGELRVFIAAQRQAAAGGKEAAA